MPINCSHSYTFPRGTFAKGAYPHSMVWCVYPCMCPSTCVNTMGWSTQGVLSNQVGSYADVGCEQGSTTVHGSGQPYWYADVRCAQGGVR